MATPWSGPGARNASGFRVASYANSISSHDTLDGVLNALDPALFEHCFVAPPTPFGVGPCGNGAAAWLGLVEAEIQRAGTISAARR